MITGISCGDVMTNKPVSAQVNDSVVKCARITKRNHVGGLIVFDKKKIVGILTEQDIVRKVVAFNKDPTVLTAKDILSKKLFSIRPGDDIFKALIIMRDENVRHLPVLEGNNFLGLVTSKDILKTEPQLFEILAEKIDLKEHEQKPIILPPGNCEECGEFSNKLFFVHEKTLCRKCRKKQLNL